MFYYIKFRKIKIKHIISRLSFNFFHLDYTHFKTSIHTGFLSWKNMRQNDDVMMRIKQNCTRTTQITMVTIYAHSKRNRQTSNIIHVLVDRNIYYAKKKPQQTTVIYICSINQCFSTFMKNNTLNLNLLNLSWLKVFHTQKRNTRLYYFSLNCQNKQTKNLEKHPAFSNPNTYNASSNTKNINVIVKIWYKLTIN